MDRRAFVKNIGTAFLLAFSTRPHAAVLSDSGQSYFVKAAVLYLSTYHHRYGTIVIEDPVHLLQRTQRIGYDYALELANELEQLGIWTPLIAGKRTVLIRQIDPWNHPDRFTQE